MDVENDELSYEYRPSDAYYQKEIELKKSLLIDEFKQADLNKDNMLSEYELLTFLDKKVTHIFSYFIRAKEKCLIGI